jgi:MSHA biogenesis protein MshK
MADRMNRSGPGAALAAALWLLAPVVQAQGLGDPTRPPGAGAAWQGSEEAAPAGKQLQSVLLSGGRKVAVISGTVVPLGGMLGEARVVKISETEVVLKTGEETETLKLFPGVDKQPVKRAAGRASPGAAAQGSSPHGGSK